MGLSRISGGLIQRHGTLNDASGTGSGIRSSKIHNRILSNPSNLRNTLWIELCHMFCQFIETDCPLCHEVSIVESFSDNYMQEPQRQFTICTWPDCDVPVSFLGRASFFWIDHISMPQESICFSGQKYLHSVFVLPLHLETKYPDSG